MNQTIHIQNLDINILKNPKFVDSTQVLTRFVFFLPCIKCIYTSIIWRKNVRFRMITIHFINDSIQPVGLFQKQTNFSFFFFFSRRTEVMRIHDNDTLIIDIFPDGSNAFELNHRRRGGTGSGFSCSREIRRNMRLGKGFQSWVRLGFTYIIGFVIREILSNGRIIVNSIIAVGYVLKCRSKIGRGWEGGRSCHVFESDCWIRQI